MNMLIKLLLTVILSTGLAGKAFAERSFYVCDVKLVGPHANGSQYIQLACSATGTNTWHVIDPTIGNQGMAVALTAMSLGSPVTVNIDPLISFSELTAIYQEQVSDLRQKVGAMFRSHAMLVLLLSLASSYVLANEVTAQQSSEGTIEMQDVLLVDALKAIAAMADREIIVKGDIRGHRVSVALEQDNVQLNLKRALHGLNHALAWGPDNKLTVWVCAAGVKDSPGSDVNVVTQPKSVSSAPASLFPDGPLVVPSSEQGNGGYTEADIAHYRLDKITVEPASLAVVPAGEEGQGTVTQVEIQQIAKSEPPLGSHTLVLPPAVPGEEGITLGELELIREHNGEDLDMSRREHVVPPD